MSRAPGDITLEPAYGAEKRPSLLLFVAGTPGQSKIWVSELILIDGTRRKVPMAAWWLMVILWAVCVPPSEPSRMFEMSGVVCVGQEGA